MHKRAYLNICLIEDELGRVMVTLEGAGDGDNIERIGTALIGQLLLAEKLSEGKLVVQVPQYSEFVQ
jgi:hypothetical protein